MKGEYSHTIRYAGTQTGIKTKATNKYIIMYVLSFVA